MRTICFDVDTQIDFLYPAGALYVPGGEALVDRIAALNKWAAASGARVISTMDAHSEDDAEFRSWPPHCVVGTTGQHKPAPTLLESRCIVRNEPGSAPDKDTQQILLEKQALDCFTNINLEALLGNLAAERYLVYGVVTELCVRHAAMGLLKTGRRVEIVRDAIKELNPIDAGSFLGAFQGAGGILTTAAQVTNL